MSYKLLILAPSAGGKSTLMRYLREHTEFEIAETDEAVMKANSGMWPNDEIKNKVLVPITTEEIISRSQVIYFASYIPDELIKDAKSKGFKLILIDLTIEQLLARNKKRMSEENYQDATPWLQTQLDNFARLKNDKMFDAVINGDQPIELLSKQISVIAAR